MGVGENVSHNSKQVRQEGCNNFQRVVIFV